jgi:monoamine oxidase
MDATRSADLLDIARAGLRPRAARPLNVVVVGAGMAGLVAAYELRRAGHRVAVLEARRRVGGRILTLRAPFPPGLYAEAGAMRLPVGHRLTRAYLDRFGLPVAPFTRASPNALWHFHGERRTAREAAADPAVLGLDLAGPGGRTVLELWGGVVRETAERVAADAGYWAELLAAHGDDSLRDFLRCRGCTAEAIAAFGLVEALEPVLDRAFLDLLQVGVEWQGTGMVRVEGGMDRLPTAFLPELGRDIRFGAELVALDYTADAVTAHYRSAAGPATVTGDCAILALPFPALRFVEVLTPFSPAKQRAIRQLHYTDAVKVLLACRRRFWEEDEGIAGGASVTDLPIRAVYYPDHGRETGRGVLTGCYTYGEEAARWRALPPEERIIQALKYVARLHPQVTAEFEAGAAKVWGEDRFAGGAFAVFAPGQQAALHAHAAAPEGPVYFAGEHTSLKHAWVEGAVESGLRAAREVHARAL